MNYKQHSKEDQLPFKYSCVQPEIKKYISTFQKDIPKIVWSHINDLYKLIEHQMLHQLKQESQMTAIKHMEAWKKYDKNLDNYNPDTRSCNK